MLETILSKKFQFFTQRLVGVFISCMFWMVQGDLRLITEQHWIIGVKTAFFSVIFLLCLSISKFNILMKSIVSTLLTTAVVVAITDHFVHPGHFGGDYGEAIVTGLTAALLVTTSGIILNVAKTT